MNHDNPSLIFKLTTRVRKLRWLHKKQIKKKYEAQLKNDPKNINTVNSGQCVIPTIQVIRLRQCYRKQKKNSQKLISNQLSVEG